MTTSKLTTRIISSILALMMLMSLLFVVLDTISPAASASTQARINRLREERTRLDKEKREVQERINDYQFEQLTQMMQKEVLDDRMKLTWSEIENVTEIIELYEILIIEQELEVTAARAREREQYDDYRARVRSMEENGFVSYLEILFSSTSFSDLLARWDFISDIMSADERAFKNLIIARQETEEAEASLRMIKVELEAEKEELENRKAELEVQIEDAIELIQQIMNTIEGEQALYDQYVEEGVRINAEIDRLVEQARREEAARRAAARRAAREGNNTGGDGGAPLVGTGALMWPTGGSVISEYGPRGGRNHYGIDISGPNGQAVVAADSGTVIVVTFQSGWGNYIVINHGNGITTLYSHLSSMAVGVGQGVSRGQYIGGVGQTGNASGPHLHFEVKVNGSYVNPRTMLG